MMDDSTLLRRYAEHRDEAAFAELVARHIALVHGAALRQVNRDAHLAADVTQAVFADLAHKAAALAGHRVLAGWLFTSTRYAAAKAIRGEQRRRAREKEAQTMNDTNDKPEPSLEWESVRPVLDEVVAELGARDREAILLRFFEGRDFAAIGTRLQLSANTARMRVERALDKLRDRLARRGITSTTAALAVVLAQQVSTAAPAGLAASVAAAATAGGAVAAGGSILAFMSITKFQIGTAAALVTVGGAGFMAQQQANAALREEIAAVSIEGGQTGALYAENRRLQQQAAEVAELRKDDGTLDQLREQAEALRVRQREAEAARLAAANAARARQAGAGVADGAINVLSMAQTDQMPRPTSRSAPQYPAEMRAAGISGEVMVDLLIDTQGNVANAFALRSSRREFEAAAVEAVAKWKFTPGKKGEKAVITRMQIPIVFTLTGQPAKPGTANDLPSNPTWF